MAEHHPVPEPLPHIGPTMDERAQRERFDALELAVVLSYYDLGIIEQIRPYPRGSRRAPKLRIRTQLGEYLLKRRAPGRDDPQRVAFAHELQLHLTGRSYPVAGLIGTRDTNSSILLHEGRTYELFQYVRARDYDQSVPETRLAGRALGRLHRELRAYAPKFMPPVGSYHNAASIDTRFAQMPVAVLTVEPDLDPGPLRGRCEFLRKAYHDAMRRAERAGFEQSARIINHGDWHPGNLLYRDGAVAAVLDFDSARREPRIADIANAALQFSMPLAAPDDPGTWPDGLDPERLRALIQGYDEGGQEKLTRPELEALPWLIVEALIVESVVPIAATGAFGRLRGSSFLEMIERKVRWIRPRAEKIAAFLEG